MEPGLYVTFFTKDEPASRELPPVGPLDNVVLRQHVLLAERRSVQQAQELDVAIDRWLEAELEMQRATGEEPGGSTRTERRFSSRDGVFLRFAVFSDINERDQVPELGPFAVVVVGPTAIDADGSKLASRVASELAVWELLSGAGDESVGLHKPDVALRTSKTSYHPLITPIPQRRVIETPASIPAQVVTAPPFEVAPPTRMPTTFELPPLEPPSIPRPAIRTPEPRPASPPAAIAPPAEPVLTSGDRAMIDQLDRDRRDETLRARIQGEERKRLGVREQSADGQSFAMRYRNQSANEEEAADDGEPGREWGPALWRLRFAIVGVLLVLAGVYTFVTVRGGFGIGPAAQQFRYVGLTQRITGTHWEYVVNAVQSSPQSGAARASGTFYIVRLAATNLLAEGQQLSPSSFSLIDANGVRHGPEGTSSGVYAPGSGVVWPATFPAGRAVSAPIVFDVDPTLPRGMMLVIDELPNVRVRLD